MAAVTNGRAVVATESNDGAIVEMAQDHRSRRLTDNRTRIRANERNTAALSRTSNRGKSTQAAPAQQGEGEPQRVTR